MSLIGLIGGVSPEATKIYYELLNSHARTRHGGQHSARCVFFMLDYGVMIGHYHDENWDAFRAEVVKGANALKAAGAEAIAITSGTTHVAADAVAEATGLPVIHMLDSLSDAMMEKGIASPLLLGTPWVMSGDFFAPALAQRFPGTPVIPTAEDRNLIGRVIFDELVNGVVKDTSREELTAMITRYADEGADGVILGCTELCMILSDGDGPLPVFSTTHIHADAINGWMAKDE
ncbi:MAG TPA: amino acid racemase [Henriciella marina]|uniref:aspartate/glutamate racemase family protein n=1 Tax=Henriciella sp. TaxID=1968823 RepID=UPI0017F02144|nr:amino acid racemase [Henriciella sp.]HIG22510.1 amino acid racemase [Henriciella sp.]HIK63642.1 amino acid racemase [Henriciella marina]